MMTVYCPSPEAQEQEQPRQADPAELQHQLDLADRMAGKLDGLFREFSDGYMEAESALEKISLWINDYNNASYPVPPEAGQLHKLMVELFSQVENYFIVYKKSNRENININSKIAKIKYDLYKESIRINYMMNKI